MADINTQVKTTSKTGVALLMLGSAVFAAGLLFAITQLVSRDTTPTEVV